MAENSAIEWTDHTFNPWTGCTRISPGCDHCYAAAIAKRSPSTFGSWQPGASRKRTSAAYWEKPLHWNRQAERDGRRMRVFCASMADVFDNQAPKEWRQDLWDLIDRTRHLDWLLLTKRPQNIMAMLPDFRPSPLPSPYYIPPNVWLGCTVENQAEANRRIPHLLRVPAAKRFLSCEPLLGPLDLTKLELGVDRYNALSGRGWWFSSAAELPHAIDWIICGGESGPGARPMHPDWPRSLRDQCAAAGVPFLFKQWGEWAPNISGSIVKPDGKLAGPSDGTPADCMRDPRNAWMRRVGKRTAGRLLDGREHNEAPA